MHRRCLAVLFALSLAAVAGPAHALDPDALRRDLAEGLNRGLPTYGTEGFGFAGIETVAQGEAVRATILDLTLPLPELGGRLQLGDLAITVAEAGSEKGPGHYRITDVTAASQAGIVDESGNQAVLINYRLERLEGIWSAALSNFLDIDALFRQFEVAVPAERLGFALAEIALVNRSVTRGDGLIDLQGEAHATGLRMINPLFGTLEVAELFADYSSHGQDLSGLESYAEIIEALNGGTAPPQGAELTAILDRLAEINILPRGFLERFRLSGLSYLDGARQPQFRLGELEFDLAGGDLHLPLGYGSLGIKVMGIEAQVPGGPAGEPLQDLVPRNLGFIASVERVPVQQMWRQILRTMALAGTAGPNGVPPEAMGAMVGTEMLSALNSAGSVLRLDRLYLEMPSGRLLGEGQLQADATVPTGAAGHLNLSVTGLDEMIALAMGAAQSGQPGPEAQGAAFLVMLKGLAWRETGPDGKPVDHLDVVLTAEGGVTVNGQPLGGLMAPPPQQ